LCAYIALNTSLNLGDLLKPVEHTIEEVIEEYKNRTEWNRI